MNIYIHGVAPFGYVRVNARLAALRTLSWPTPSFFASMSLGIRLVPLLAYRIYLFHEIFYLIYSLSRSLNHRINLKVNLFLNSLITCF